MWLRGRKKKDTLITTPTPLGGRYAGRVPDEVLDHARDVGLVLMRTLVERPSYVLGITSALPTEGKTALSLGLAEVMSTDFGLEVVLLDAHAERPWVPDDEEATPRLGISNWLSGNHALSEMLIPVHSKCSLLPFGTNNISSRDVLQYFVTIDPLQQLRERYSLTLLDLPDLANPAAAALANKCDGLIIIVRSGETPAEAIREFLPVLQNVTIHGVILNRYKTAIPASIRRLF